MSELDELQRLLLGDGKRLLDELGPRLRSRAQRAQFLAEVLPEALRDANTGTQRLVRSLQVPVTHCIRQSVQRDSRLFAEALYPAMGPAIRRSIAETLRQFVQSLNQVLEHSLSLRGLRWRFEAWRSGIPFAEVVLKNTLLYRVEEIYLIQRDSGLLAAHVSVRGIAPEQDQDAVSAMFTAIQDFVRDTFSGDSEGGLETLELGGRLVWVVGGSEAMMACVLRGIPPPGLRDRLRNLVEEVHQVHGEALAAFAGDRTSLAGIPEMLDQGLESESRAPEGSRRRIWPAVLLALLLLGGAAAGIWYLGRDPWEPARHALVRTLGQEPGLVVLEQAVRDGVLRVRGLRDPLGRDPAQLAAASGLPPDRVRFDFRPFQSLEPGLVLSRVRHMLRPPVSVDLALQGTTLVVRGRALPNWTDRVRGGLVLPAGVDALDLSALEDDGDAMLQRVRLRLDPPAGVDLRLDGRKLTISGEAPWAWQQGIDSTLSGVGWLGACDASKLEVTEWQQARDRSADMDGIDLGFVDGLTLTEAGSKRLSGTLERIEAIRTLIKPLRIPLAVSVTGWSDGTGTQAWNIWLRHQRAEFLKKRLLQAGLPAEWVRTGIEPWFESSAQPDPVRRKAVLTVHLPRAPIRPFTRCTP